MRVESHFSHPFYVCTGLDVSTRNWWVPESDCIDDVRCKLLLFISFPPVFRFVTTRGFPILSHIYIHTYIRTMYRREVIIKTIRKGLLTDPDNLKGLGNFNLYWCIQRNQWLYTQIYSIQWKTSFVSSLWHCQGFKTERTKSLVAQIHGILDFRTKSFSLDPRSS